ncbi:MAG: hypothetical protein UR68_C0004G0005 [Candidatus Roizmanbacteria bacterium GW2011_GWA2_35_19]|uniref:Peptidase S1 domain-containing protein n=2 Tax=Candidatus Roizmaniibacteriota TaxID=1752723 RepID=A0A0G0F231_9BACT|nr:MAG: hypothetical protein UR63_C0026G0004 [Candidatus Roizmanbacteria bacterium GW2011_GWC2_35_12]KKP73452.1 MAG: hypothetical protein UR68_C0004G0005 [Candidatus Roizmanbacteria bacterium GW2011_GWA2_35_19]
MKSIAKFCFSKKYLYILLVVVLLITYLLFSNSTVKQKNVIQSKAAPPAIIGGQDVKPGEFPEVTLIRGFNDEYDSICTGTLIAPRWVLTVTHCLGDEWKEIYVSVGITNKSEINKSLIRAIKRFTFFPGFPFNDVGLILLGREVSGVKYPKLPNFDLDRDIFKKGNLTTAVGWGFVGYTPVISPTPMLPIETDKLQKIVVPIYSDIKDDFLKYRFFTIGEPGKQIIDSADSGGPVFYKKNNTLYLIGINSYIESRDQILNAVVNVAKYTDWINKQILKYTSVYPTLTPAPFVLNNNYDEEWKICSHFKTVDECDQMSGLFGCGFQTICNVCMPWNHTDIDYDDCQGIIEKINKIKLTVTPTSTPKPTIINRGR